MEVEMMVGLVWWWWWRQVWPDRARQADWRWHTSSTISRNLKRMAIAGRSATLTADRPLNWVQWTIDGMGSSCNLGMKRLSNQVAVCFFVMSCGASGYVVSLCACVCQDQFSDVCPPARLVVRTLLPQQWRIHHAWCASWQEAELSKKLINLNINLSRVFGEKIQQVLSRMVGSCVHGWVCGRQDLGLSLCWSDYLQSRVGSFKSMG